jgi:SPP1 family predicted phage head-tail adaptor
MIDAGRLNQFVSIQRLDTARDAAGQPSTSWTEVAAVWADIRAQSGISAAMTLAANRAVDAVNYSVRIRALDGIAAGMRVVVGTTTLMVRHVLPDFAGGEYTDLVCALGVA